MINRELMLSALKSNTLPILKAQGFTGSYPHFRRFREDRIDLLSFQTNKYGGSFTVEVSAAFPNAKDTNYALYGNMSEKTLNVTAANKRYRLPGMFDGWFYYTDLYEKRTLLFGRIYYGVNERESETFIPGKGYKLVQKFDANTATSICLAVNKQLENAFAWLDTFRRQ